MNDVRVCATNLGPRQTRLRLVAGVAGVALGLATAAAALYAGLVPRWVALLPLGFGFLSLLQARART